MAFVLAGVRDDVMLYSYLLNPTHSTHRLEDVAARFDNQSLRGEGEEALPMAAATIARLAPQLRRAVEDSDTLKVYETIDLPLTPILLDMEDAGVRIDSAYLQRISERLAEQMHTLAECIYGNCGHRFNINSPKQLGDVFVQQNGAAQAHQMWQGQSCFHRAGCAGRTRRASRSAADGAGISPACEVEVELF